MFGCGSVWPKRKPTQPDTILFKAPVTADRPTWTVNIPCRFYPFDFEKHQLCYKHFEPKYLVQKSEEEGTPLNILDWTLSPDAVPTLFDTSVLDKSLDKKRRRNDAKNCSRERKRCRREGVPVPDLAAPKDSVGNPLPGPSSSVKEEDEDEDSSGNEQD